MWSRLSPSLDCVVSDPLLLTYFTRFLRECDSENVFRFWLELSGLIQKKKVTHNTDADVTNETFISYQQLDILRDRMNRLPVTDATSIYFRYLSREAKLPVTLPLELLCCALVALLDNPLNTLALIPCLRYAETCLKDELLPYFLRDRLFMEFRSEIITNGQLNLDDIMFDDTLLLNFVEYLGNKPEAILFTFLLAVSAYKKEFSELTSISDVSRDSSEEHYRQLLEDATTICAKFLSPASEDFMNLNLEEYRNVLDQACSEEEPRNDCFDSLYEVIHRKVEKRVLPGFFTSSPFLRYRAQFISTLG
uniref:A-kinase anchor protein 10 n=1 Tax=Schistocephalus solidus TaxID=70667 RepID=A0A0X3P867_SCHSO